MKSRIWLYSYAICQLVKSHVKQTCSWWINDAFNERGGKEVTAEREEGSHRAKPFERGFQKFGTAPIFQKQNGD